MSEPMTAPPPAPGPAPRLLVGDCRVTLGTLPPASVQCCITSPPYYGLRAYGTEPLVWGGDVSCAHVWGTEARRVTRDNLNSGFNERWGNSPGQRKQEQSRPQVASSGTVCGLCGAWRGELGQEPTLDCVGWATGAPCGVCYVCHLVDVFRAVRRALTEDGVCFINLGDSYSNAGQSGNDRRAGQATGGKVRYTPVQGLGEKQLLGVPSRVYLALQADGWTARAFFPWLKANAMPESVTDRPTLANEWWLMLTPGPRYYWNADAIRQPNQGIERPHFDGMRRLLPKHDIPGQSVQRDRAGNHPDGRNYRTTDAWFTSLDAILTAHRAGGLLLDADGLPIGQNQPTQPYKAAHFATFPPELIEPFVRAGTRPGDIVLDPFGGTGTVASVALQWQRAAIICELNPAYAVLAEARIGATQPALLTEDVA